jgi:hypothetical protein
MADLFIDALPTTTTIKRADLFVVETDPAGTQITKAMAALDFAKGWIEIPDSWTYASATTINVPTNATLLYQKGWGIRFKQGGAFKYAYMTTVAATLLTVTGGSDYTVANAAITDIAVCPNPHTAFGFPDWFNYAPVVNGSAGSAGTYAESESSCKFAISGKMMHTRVHKVVSNVGSWTGTLRVSTPTTVVVQTAGTIVIGGAIYASGATAATQLGMLYETTTTSWSFIKTVRTAEVTWADVAANVGIHIDTHSEI